MAVTVRINGSLELRRLSAAIKAAGDKGLGREMSTALRRVARPVNESIRAELLDTLPERGGYRATVAKSVRFRTAIRATSRTGYVQVTVFAEGESEKRDIRRLNRGELRHPVYGRSRTVRAPGSTTGYRRVPNPWATTNIRAGFFDRGTEVAGPLAEEQLREVLADFAARLAKG